jgi:hypothetical protein
MFWNVEVVKCDSSTLCLIGWCNRIGDDALECSSIRLMMKVNGLLGLMNSLFELKACYTTANV